MMPETNYIWDPVSDSYLMETDENHAATAVYTSEPDSYGRVISQHRDDVTSYYKYDALGSTRQLTNSAAVVTGTNLYDAWGADVVSTGTTANRLRWIGEHGYCTDEELTRAYVRARTFWPMVARWESVDPFFGPSSQYLYPQPITAIDPSGLWRIVSDGRTASYTKDCINRCCNPIGSFHQSTVFEVGNRDRRDYVFFQQVRSTVRAQGGAYSDMCHLNSCIQCTTFEVVLKEEFVEAFNPWRPGLRFTDHHSFGTTIIQGLWNVLNAICSDGIDKCCGWKLTKTTEKSLVFAPGLPNMNRNDRAWVSDAVMPTATIDRASCQTCTQNPPGLYDSIVKRISYPSVHKNIILPFPAMARPVYVRTDEFSLSHEKGATSQVGRYRSTGYVETP